MTELRYLIDFTQKDPSMNPTETATISMKAAHGNSGRLRWQVRAAAGMFLAGSKAQRSELPSSGIET